MNQTERTSELSLSSRITGGIIGLAAGDALGVPVEFTDRESLAKDPVTGMRGWGTHNQPPGSWSDDTSMSLCLLESLNLNGWDIEDQGARYVQWLKAAHLTAWDEVFDVGGATQAAIDRISHGTRARNAGSTDEHSNGNGSLMRNLPAAIFCSTLPDPELLIKLAEASAVTHAHPRSLLGCVIHGLITAELLKGKSPADAIDGAHDRLDAMTKNGDIPEEMAIEIPAYERALDPHIGRLSAKAISSSGYVVHTLEASLWCLCSSASFDECLLMAVNLGSDTDTTGAVAGGLAGICWGAASIPEAWTKELARLALIEGMAKEFVRVCNHDGSTT